MLKLTMDGKPVAGQEGQNGLFASAVLDANANTVIVKVINTGKTAQNISLNLIGLKGEKTAKTITLNHNVMDDENSI